MQSNSQTDFPRHVWIHSAYFFLDAWKNIHKSRSFLSRTSDISNAKSGARGTFPAEKWHHHAVVVRRPHVPHCTLRGRKRKKIGASIVAGSFSSRLSTQRALWEGNEDVREGMLQPTQDQRFPYFSPCKGRRAARTLELATLTWINIRIFAAKIYEGVWTGASIEIILNSRRIFKILTRASDVYASFCYC